MEYMFQPGFFGTRAPFFMDMVTFIVAALPLLIVLGIYLAKIKMYKTHAFVQNFIFIISVIVVGYFEFGVRIGGGFKVFMQGSGASYTYASVVLGIHIFISIITLYFWIITLVSANKLFFQKRLHGLNAILHRKLALRTFIGVAFTSFSGIWVYILLFVY
jgi:putative membrane protein